MNTELARQLPNNVIMKIIREATTLKWRDNFSEVVAQVELKARMRGLHQGYRDCDYERTWMGDPHHSRYWKSPFQKNTYDKVIREIIDTYFDEILKKI